jgi:hypothetical protein
VVPEPALAAVTGTLTFTSEPVADVAAGDSPLFSVVTGALTLMSGAAPPAVAEAWPPPVLPAATGAMTLTRVPVTEELGAPTPLFNAVTGTLTLMSGAVCPALSVPVPPVSVVPPGALPAPEVLGPPGALGTVGPGPPDPSEPLPVEPSVTGAVTFRRLPVGAALVAPAPWSSTVTGAVTATSGCVPAPGEVAPAVPPDDALDGAAAAATQGGSAAAIDIGGPEASINPTTTPPAPTTLRGSERRIIANMSFSLCSRPICLTVQSGRLPGRRGTGIEGPVSQ